MSELSDPTLAVLVEAGQKLPESELTTMLMRTGIYERSPRKTGIASENKAASITGLCSATLITKIDVVSTPAT